MRVKIKDTWYDVSMGPICVELTPKDRENIASMSEDATRYAQFPNDPELSVWEKLAWMD